MPILGHLTALRNALGLAFFSWLVCAIIAGAAAPRILDFLVSPARDCRDLLQGLDLVSGFSITMEIAIWGGLAFSFPLVVFSLLRFVFPALTRREKALLLSILGAGSLLFLAGVALAYSQTLPMVVTAFRAINEWVGLSVNTVRIEGYISIALKTIVAFGLVFQLPLILFVLGLFGAVSSAALASKRRFAIVASFVVAMFLTPPDPMSQILMAVPLCILYELSIWAVKLVERK